MAFNTCVITTIITIIVAIKRIILAVYVDRCRVLAGMQDCSKIRMFFQFRSKLTCSQCFNALDSGVVDVVAGVVVDVVDVVDGVVDVVVVDVVAGVVDVLLSLSSSSSSSSSSSASSSSSSSSSL